MRTSAAASRRSNPSRPAAQAGVALAAVLLGTSCVRPSAADRQRRQAQEDVERAWSLLGAAFEKAKEHSQLGTAKLEQLGRDAMNDPGAYAGVALRAFEQPARVTADRTWRTMQRATVESRAVGQALRREAETRPLGALMLLGLGIGMAMLGTRGIRASR